MYLTEMWLFWNVVLFPVSPWKWLPGTGSTTMKHFSPLSIPESGFVETLSCSLLVLESDFLRQALPPWSISLRPLSIPESGFWGHTLFIASSYVELVLNYGFPSPKCMWLPSRKGTTNNAVPVRQWIVSTESWCGYVKHREDLLSWRFQR